MATPRVGELGILSATGSMLYRDADGNVTEVSPGGAGNVLTLVGGVPTWQSSSIAVDEFVVFTPDDAIFGEVQGFQNAEPGVRNLRPILEFDDTVLEAIVFSGAMAAHYDVTHSLEVRIDWSGPATVGGGDVQWLAAWESLSLLADNIDANSFATAQGAVGMVPGTSGQIQRTTITFTSAEADGIAPGEDFRLQISRDPADDDDDMVGDADVIRVSIVEI